MTRYSVWSCGQWPGTGYIVSQALQSQVSHGVYANAITTTSLMKSQTLRRLFATQLVLLAIALVALFKPAIDPAIAGSGQVKVAYGEDNLPEPVQEMRQAIMDAAVTGDLEAMRIPIELNELAPTISEGPIVDAIRYWQKNSSDGTGREILAILLDLLDTGYVRVMTGGESAMYIWPYFAETSLKDLTPTQQVELYRVASPADVRRMRKQGRYTGYRIGIGEDGVWHDFVKNE